MNEQVSMGPVVVLFHSAYGHTQRMAQAVEQGARELAETQLITIDANGEITAEDWQTLNKAAAIIMGTPTYMNMVSWQFKKWADTSSNGSGAQRNDVNYLGSSLGAMATTPSDASAGQMLAGDLESARLFGTRVAQVAQRWAR